MSVEVSLRHTFPGFTLDVTFALPRPGVTALFGASGAGKTSIVNAIAGTFRPEHGRIVLNGRVVLDTASGVFVPASARRTGYVFQDARLFPHMSVRDNLLFGWRRATVKAVEADIAHVIELLGIGHLLDRKPRALSGGEEGRVALGRALLSSPAILLLDEPLASLDAQRRAEVLPYLERLRDETKLPMLYVSHAVDEVARLADDIVVVDQGKVAVSGSVFDVLTDLELSALAGAPPVGAVIAATVSSHREDGLTALAFDGGTLFVSRLAATIGARVRMRVRAEEIMLALEEPRGISANNILPTKVLAVAETGTAHADVQLACGATRLVARITRASSARLGLSTGKPVFAIVKSVTVDLAGL
ncbi:MAG: molybdenum ABC transporter ATP-binding protein [Alphaproteobacteria bacterium]|nr:molybdenum ABC transporter ATP-binding protein [Alphaproteobacteria bacterium]